MINAYACVALSSSSATASPPARPLCAAAPVRPCCNTSRALGAGAWNYLRIPGFELFFRAGPHPAGFFMGNSTHHPPPKQQQHRGFEPLGFARPPGPQSLRRRHLPENAGAHPAAGSDGPGGAGGSGGTPTMPAAQMLLPGPAPACPQTPGACMGAWQEHGPRRPSTVQCGTAHTESTLHLHYPSMQYAYICIPTTHLRIDAELTRPLSHWPE